MLIGKNLKCEYSVSEAIGQLIIWILLVIVTFGLAAFVLPYYFLKGPINRTFVVDSDGAKLAQLNVEVYFGDILGHALLWLLLTIVTFGLAYLIYWPAVIKRLMNGGRLTEL